MNLAILDKETQHFIQTNLKTVVPNLVLRGSSFPKVSIQEIAEQIISKNKCEKKLPTWFHQENIYYPHKINIEQTSSEITATYKANLVSGSHLIDITGGFGVDSYYFSKKIKQVTHCEINSELIAIAKHNSTQLNVNNIDYLNEDGIAFLKKSNTTYDWIYADPSRRNESKEKVILLEDCSPNIKEYIDLLLTKAAHIIIKVSPILDITKTINDLKNVKEVHIIGINNEVKELLFIIEKDFNETLLFKTINYTKKESQCFNFTLNTKESASYTEPKKFLYEPNACILKGGAFQQISCKFNIEKLHKHSHLYTSESLVKFPGRIFEIQHCINYDKKQLKKLIPTKKANITVRNFPESVSQIRKKTGLKEGGDIYVFFTTTLNNLHKALICKKI